MDHESNPPEREHLFRRLREWTKDQAGQWVLSNQEEAITLVVRDKVGNIAGGVFGDAFLGHFFVKIFWIETQYRKKGLGTKLMKQLEEEARKSGCVTISLETLDFQAEGFYNKLGYQKFSELEFFPGGPVKIYMRKTLNA